MERKYLILCQSWDEPYRFVGKMELEDIIAEASLHGIDTFLATLPNDPVELWPERSAVVFEVDIVLPRPVTTRWTIERD